MARVANGDINDIACDAAIHILVFVAIGYSLMDSQLGIWALLMGIVSGLSVACIFHLRNEMEQQFGKDATRQPHFAGLGGRRAIPIPCHDSVS